MIEARFHFHGDLNDFLPPNRRGRPFAHPFAPDASLKDTIEALGVPHPEVDLVVVDGAPLPLHSRLPGDVSVDVYPLGDGPSGHDADRLIPRPPGAPWFLLDGHLGGLASRLRMLGFDVAWDNPGDDAQLAERSAREDRVLLTRDKGLLKRAVVRRGSFIRNTAPLAQTREVLERFALRSHARPFTRCLRCNASLASVEKADIIDRLPERVRQCCDRFLRCPVCDRLYWEGTHHARMARVVQSLLDGT